jgi:hypothetical protein
MRVLLILCATACFGAAVPRAQTPEPAVPAARFVGTWVGTQAWAIANPPPGSRNDQPVTLVIENVDGKLRGTMTPFLGGEDGASFVDGQIVGSELRATATAGRAGRAAAGWAPVRVAFSFTNDGLAMKGTAAVRMGDVPWMTYTYQLEKKRSRY